MTPLDFSHRKPGPGDTTKRNLRVLDSLSDEIAQRGAKVKKRSPLEWIGDTIGNVKNSFSRILKGPKPYEVDYKKDHIRERISKRTASSLDLGNLAKYTIG